MTLAATRGGGGLGGGAKPRSLWTPMDYAESVRRFWAKAVVQDDGCWVLDKAPGYIGYQQAMVGGRKSYAHRIAWTMAYGPIPASCEIDHTCRNRACINPLHLAVVTHIENVRRKPAASRKPPIQRRASYDAYAIKQCRAGHEMNDLNRSVTSEGYLRCRICLSEAVKRSGEKWKRQNATRITTRQSA